MLVDGGAAVNLMPYSLYRKLGKQDDELVKTNMTLSGVGTDNSIKARGVTSVELTIKTKTLVVAFFVADVEGNYSLILAKDWIHAVGEEILRPGGGSCLAGEGPRLQGGDV
jgi:hypothetical protein